jgi:deoxycytidine triphosphate deaminase
VEYSIGSKGVNNLKHIFGSQTKSTLTNVQEGDVQPNAVDLRLDRVFKILPTVFELSDENKSLRETVEVTPIEGWFHLEPGDYEVVMANIISVADGEAGWVITRSTLNRSNITLTSGLYDAGFTGRMCACMHVGTGPARIKQGTRIGQYLCFDAETLHLYDGSYGLNRSGQPKPDEAKYHK